jgi:S-adenosylmethionine hydrolase
LYWPQISRLGRSILGEVLYIDGFGNVFTNIRERDLTGIAFDKIRVSIGDLEFQGISDNYTAGETGNYLAVINSWGLIEVALYKDSAAKRSKIKVGDKVQIECSP